MAAKTIYCARAFWWRQGRLWGGEVRQFLNEERAIAGAEALYTGAHGVAVFSVTGHPDVDLWEDPQLIATYGDVPSVTGNGSEPDAEAA